MIGKKRKNIYVFITILLLLSLLYAFSQVILSSIGSFLVYDERPVPSDAVVVLCTGVEYYPRLIEASNLYRRGLANKIVINGGRKTDVLRDLEQKGFTRCCPWYENSLRILSILGVPREEVICITAEDPYDTVSEAEVVGNEILQRGFRRIIIATSKSHTRRAHFIWTRMFKNKLSVCSVSAETDPYNPNGWWKKGRQIRWVMAEYGAWIYYFWKKVGF